MKEKEVIKDVTKTVVDNLPKTVSAIDNVLSSIVSVADLLFTPFQIARIYKDSKINDFKANLETKVKKIPQEDLKESANLNIVGPALEALKYTILEDDLREMFENLLASSLDKREDVFPGFVDVIRQLSSDEAKLLKHLALKGNDFPLIDLRYVLSANKGFREILVNFSNIGDGVCERVDLVSAYLDELEKFGLITIEDDIFLTDESLYKPLESHQTIVQLKQTIVHNEPGTYEVHRKKFKITAYGRSFISSCVISKK